MGFGKFSIIPELIIDFEQRSHVLCVAPCIGLFLEVFLSYFK